MIRARIFRRVIFGATVTLCTAAAYGQAPAAGVAGWQQCSTITGDGPARLACFDRWVAQQGSSATNPVTASSTAASAANNPVPATPTNPAGTPVNALIPATRVISVATDLGCRDPQYSDLSRFWELETGSDCGTFNIRGYRPISLSWVGSNGTNKTPSSPTPGHTAAYTDYSNNETRLQLSVRTKIAQGLLTQGDPVRRDSLWFGYTQQSYWQLFNGELSRPFRSTDHEPEVVYAYPFDATLAGGWRVRYGGIGLVHQSNGQTLPLSRSWNRVYLMGGMEKGNDLRLQARVWQRLRENPADDDNPDISNYIGRAEVTGWWDVNKANTLGVTLRTSLRSDANGSVRFEWLKALGNDNRQNALRFHTQLFTGYGDSLLDYNRRRTVLSIGLSLVDF